MFVRLLKRDADQLGEILPGCADAQALRADAARDAEISAAGQLGCCMRVTPAH